MSNKGRQPDLIIYSVVEENGHERWMELTRVWNGKNGSFSGDAILACPDRGRIVMVPPKLRSDEPSGAPASDDHPGPSY